MPKKFDKKSLSKEINNALGFGDDKIDFTKLTKEDLIKLHERVSKPRNLIFNVAASKGEDFVSTILAELIKKKEEAGGLPIGKGKLAKKIIKIFE